MTIKVTVLLRVAGEGKFYFERSNFHLESHNTSCIAISTQTKRDKQMPVRKRDQKIRK